ncbi:MAG: hypothetical protein JXB03_07175 [Spirochaetales bacterium]|nr:hypothetical protein [Spirochaetales bacterium]
MTNHKTFYIALFAAALPAGIVPHIITLPVPPLAAGILQTLVFMLLIFAAVKTGTAKNRQTARAPESDPALPTEPILNSLGETEETGAQLGAGEQDDQEDYQSLLAEVSSSLFNDAKLIDVYHHQLAQVIQTTDEAADTLITSFMDINGAVKKLNEIVKALLHLGRQSEDGSQGNVLLEMKEVVHKITESFAMTKDLVARNYLAFKRYGSHMETIQKTIPMINEIIDKMKVLSINASIEAARAGNSGHGFKVVANEFRTLTDKFNSSKEIIENTISEASVFSRETFEASRETETEFLGVFENSVELLDGISDSISRKITDSTKKAMSAYELSKIIASDIQKIVVSIQFQDITRQRIEHVQTPLTELAATLNTVGELLHTKIAHHLEIDEQKLEKYKKLFSMRSEREIFHQHFDKTPRSATGNQPP